MKTTDNNLSADGIPGGTTLWPRSAGYGLGILMVAYLFGHLDKQIFALLLDPIGKTLALSDTQLGALHGPIFSLPYSVCVLLTGWGVDRFPRKTILFSGVVVWSLAASCSGLATTFGQLAVARAMLGVGEAALIPSAMSIIASLFARDRVSTAIGLFYSAATGGGAIALVAGGALVTALGVHGSTVIPLLSSLEPWQVALVLTGLPGLLFAGLVFTIPIDDSARRRPRTDASRPSPARLSGFVLDNRRLIACYFVASTLISLIGTMFASWSPTFFGRVHGWSAAQISLVMAAGMIAGLLGSIFWGALADRLRSRGRRDGLFLIYILAPWLAMPVAAVALFSPNAAVSIAAFVATGFVVFAPGPLMAALQLIAPDTLRGRMTSLKMVFTGIFSFGAGPIVVGALTEHLFHDHAKVGHSLLLAMVVAVLIASICLFLSRKAFLDLLTVQEAERDGPLKAAAH